MRMRWTSHILCAFTLVGGLRASVGAELTGVVQDNLGNGLSNLTVYGSIQTPTQFFLGLVSTADHAGRFTLVGEPGYWWVSVDPAQLHARGYFEVYSGQLSLTGQASQASVRLTTRQLDFTHRIAGRLLDEEGHPLRGYSFEASIRENGPSFRTNVTTATDGAFVIAAVPAIWTLCCLSRPEGTPVRVFPDRQVEVVETNTETTVTFVAPAATATISVTTSNLRRWDVVVATEAFGETYRLAEDAFSDSGFPTTFYVFDGVWTVSARKPSLFFGSAQQVTAPAPVLVAVTNNNGAVTLAGIPPPSSSLQVQWVRTITSSGAAVPNALVSASSDAKTVGEQFSPQVPVVPGFHQLVLEPGAWRVRAEMSDYLTFPASIGWTVEREVVIRSNIAPADITIVFPEPNSGPRISGTVRCPDGTGLAGQSVRLQTVDNGSRYVIWLYTDALGRFGTNVVPGRWETGIFSPCQFTSLVVVSNQDAKVDFEVCQPAGGAPVPVTINLVDEGGPFPPDAWVSLHSGSELLETNIASIPARMLLRPGIWSASFSGLGYGYGYTRYPSITWELPTGVAATNLVLVTRQATTRIVGRLRDDQGRLLTTGFATAWTSVNGTNFWAHSQVDSGYFSLNVFPGEWQVGASVRGYPSVGVPGDLLPLIFFGLGSEDSTRDTTPAPRFLRVSNSVVKCEFVVTNQPLPEKVTLVARVVRENGDSVNNGRFYAYQDANGELMEYHEGQLNEDGIASFELSSGKFQVGVSRLLSASPEEPLLWPSLSFDVMAPSNHVVLVVRSAPVNLSGTVSNVQDFALMPYLSANTVLNGTNYFSSACTDTSGRFSLPVFPGQWTLEVDDYYLNAFGLQSIAPREVAVPPTGSPGTVDFSLAPITGDFRLARLVNPVLLPNGAVRLELHGQADLGWRIERSEDLREWAFVSLQPTPGGTVVIEEPPVPSPRTAFYRAVWVR